MPFQRVCSMDDVWEGEMHAFEVGDRQVLVVHVDGGVLRAFDAVCPHQDYPLVEGELEGGVLTCKMHRWRFDVASSESLNPTGHCLKTYPLTVEDDQVFVDLDLAPVA